MFSLSPLYHSKVYDCAADILATAFNEVRNELASKSAENLPVLVAAVAAAVEAAASQSCADFKEQWNKSNPDLIMRLPTEVSTTCFRMLNIRSRFTVSHVSRAWRRVALADRMMWTNVRVELYKPHSLEKMATLLSRSEPAPFHLFWDLHRSPDAVEELIQLLSRDIARMQSFKVDFGTHDHRSALARLADHPAPLLQNLVLENRIDDSVILPGLWSARGAPRLQRLSVGLFSVPPDFEPCPSLREFQGNVRFSPFDQSRDFRLHNLFNLFPCLTSLSLLRFTDRDLSTLPALPSTLTDVLFDPDMQGHRVDFADFVDGCMGDTVLRFRAHDGACIPASIDAFSRKVRGTWSLTINAHGGRDKGATCESDGNGLHYTFITSTRRWWREPPFMCCLDRLASLTLPWGMLLDLVSEHIVWDSSLPALRTLATNAITRDERKRIGALMTERHGGKSAAPISAPQLETLAVTLSQPASTYTAAWVARAAAVPSSSHVDEWAAIPAVLPLLVAHGHSQLAVARVTFDRQLTAQLELGDAGSAALLGLARHVLFEDQYRKIVLAEFFDGERAFGPPCRPPRPDEFGTETEDHADEW